MLEIFIRITSVFIVTYVSFMVLAIIIVGLVEWLFRVGWKSGAEYGIVATSSVGLSCIICDDNAYSCPKARKRHA